MSHDYSSGVRQHWTGGDAECLWRCPQGDHEVLATDWPPPTCPDHPFDEMVREDSR
jgi:hypothetical protein